MIYFIQESEPGRNRVKIGYTSKDDVGQRMRELQTASPSSLSVLGVMEGEQVRERLIHALFSDRRIIGEWFEPNNLLMNFIKEFGDMGVSTPAAMSASETPDVNLPETIRNMIKSGARLEKNSSGYYRLRWQVKDAQGKPVVSDSGTYVRKSMYIPTEIALSITNRAVSINGDIVATGVSK